MRSMVYDADRIKRSVTDVWAVLHALGIAEGSKRQTRGAFVCCPWHVERTPSCSVTTGSDGSLRTYCFGCGQGGDLFSLAAAVLGLDVRRDFVRVVREVSARCGLDGSVPLPPPPRRQALPPQRRPPPLLEVATFWARCIPVCENPGLSQALLGLRGLDPAVITDRDLARSLPPEGTLPSWARHHGQSWRDSGHILIVPLVDAQGEIQSVHARSLRPGDEPKGLSPACHSSAGLLLADSFAREVLAHGIPSWWNHSDPPTFIVAEGCPDFLTVACRYGDWESTPATVAVLNGSWSKEVADRIPDGCRVVIRTHSDTAGMKYRREVAESLCKRCRVEVRRYGK